MATIQPKGERLRQAVRWISSERVEDDTKAISMLINQAAMKFNLSPKEDLEAVEDLFIETTRKVARSSGEEAKNVLNDLADKSKRTTSVLREKARHAGEAAAERLKDDGKDAAKATAEAAGKGAQIMAKEARELGKRSVAVAKGAISGLLKGAKEALKKEKEE